LFKISQFYLIWKKIEPSNAGIRPNRVFNKVVFPTPFFPEIATFSPLFIRLYDDAVDADKKRRFLTDGIYLVQGRLSNHESENMQAIRVAYISKKCFFPYFERYFNVGWFCATSQTFKSSFFEFLKIDIYSFFFKYFFSFGFF